MQFAAKLRQRVKDGEITTSIRIWMKPRVKEGGRYKLLDGYVVVDRMTQIQLQDITAKMARDSGFLGLVDLMKTAKHGRGENVYLIEFHYEDEGEE